MVGTEWKNAGEAPECFCGGPPAPRFFMFCVFKENIYKTLKNRRWRASPFKVIKKSRYRQGRRSPSDKKVLHVLQRLEGFAL